VLNFKQYAQSNGFLIFFFSEVDGFVVIGHKMSYYTHSSCNMARRAIQSWFILFETPCISQ